jgi:HEAT repeat protein
MQNVYMPDSKNKPNSRNDSQQQAQKNQAQNQVRNREIEPYVEQIVHTTSDKKNKEGYGDKSKLNKEYVTSLAASTESSALAELIKLSTHPNVGIRLAVVEALGERKEDETIIHLWHIMKEDKKWIVRRRAVEVLSKKGHIAVASILLSAADKDKRWIVRLAAVKALYHFKFKSVLDTLDKIAQCDANQQVRNEALRIAERIRKEMQSNRDDNAKSEQSK